MTHSITFGIVTGQHGHTWDQLVQKWQIAEEFGFDSGWLFDHFTGLNGNPDSPTLEASTLLAGLALEISRLELGVLVYGNTHRHPAILTKEMVTIDHISKGRAIFGIGAGWNEDEHRYYRLDLPKPGPRVRQFEEAMTIIHGLLENDRFSFAGEFYHIEDSPFSPKPVRQPMPILIGASGPKMLRVVAKHADIWDGGGRGEERLAKLEELRKACDEVGRDYDSIVQSQNMGSLAVDDPGEVERLIEQHLEMGVHQFLFGMPSEPDQIERFQRVAGEVLPKYRPDSR